MPTVSVILTSHNHGPFLRQAIESVLAQTYTDFELLILDDASTDGSADIAREYVGSNAFLQDYQEKASSLGVVLNRSIRLARGDYWVWAPSDDVLKPDLLEKKMATAQEHPGAVLYSDWEYINERGDVTGTKRLPEWTAEDIARMVWEKSMLGFTGIWIPMSVFDEVGNWPTHMLFSEDFSWFVRATIHGIPFINCPEVLFQKRLNPLQTASKVGTKRILELVPAIHSELRWYQHLYQQHHPDYEVPSQ